MNKKNVIIIMIDGGRLDRAKRSEIFNQIKTKSMFFSQCITYGPHTIAAMHAVFSGCYGTRTGTNSYWSTFDFKKNRFKTITEYLKEQNYHTFGDLINELVVPKQGFDEFIIHDEINDDLVKRHKKLLHNMKILENKNENFFLYLHYSKIHTGIMNEVLKVYDNFSEGFFNNKNKNENRYDKLFHDAEIYTEEIINEIEKLGLDKNAIILLMSDHGVSIGEKIGERAYGAFCYDYTLRPFVYIIQKELQPKEITEQVRTIDLMPTILDFLEIKLDKKFEKLDGESLINLMNNSKSFENIAYSETGNPLKSKEPPEQPNTKSVRTSKWKLIFNEYNNTRELYDLENDPSEEVNLINEKLEIEKTLWEELFKISNNLP